MTPRSQFNQMSSTHEIFLRISPDKFHMLKFILEGYDNLAILSSDDRKNGIVRVRYISDSSPELFALLGSLAPKLV